MRAVMLAFACRQQYHALRAAAAAGYSVDLLGQSSARGLKYSRYCSSYRTLNFDPLTQSVDVALAEIEKRVKEVSADIILPSDIISTRLLVALAGRLPVPTCALPDRTAFDTMNDKWLFYQFCRDHKVSVPQTWLFADAEELKAAALAGTVPFPFIIKPHDAMGGSGIYRVMNKEDLKLADEAYYKPLLVQKMLTGGEIDISVLAVKGKIAAYAIQRNLPDKFEFVRHDALLEHTTRLVEASNFNGLAHFDAMEDDAGNIYLIECNPRVWLSIFASAAAGLDFMKISINPKSVNSNHPLSLIKGDVDDRGSTVGLVMKLIKERSTNKADYALLKYNLADPIGKKVSRMPKFNDATLSPDSPGSIAYQVAAMNALMKA